MNQQKPVRQEEHPSPKYSVDVHITECNRAKNASAFFRQGAVHVKLPRRWNKAYKTEVTAELIRRVLRKEEAERELLASHVDDDVPTITLATQAALHDYVHRINAETFQVPVGKIQIGKARYTRLAQINLRTRAMTVSQFCLHEVPESALRYLIIHELAHLLEAGHTKRFWSLVGQFVPDYRKQSRLMKAYHRRAVTDNPQPDAPEKPATPQAETPTAPRRRKQATETQRYLAPVVDDEPEPPTAYPSVPPDAIQMLLF